MNVRFSFLLLLCISFFKVTYAQDYVDQKFYLVDSLQKENLSKTDLELLDSTLTKYHESNSDTAKLKYLNYIVEQCWNINVWPKYNLLINKECDIKLSEISNEMLIKWYLTLKATSINNIGFFHGSHGATDLALQFYDQGLEIQKAIPDSFGMANTLNNIGGVLMFLGRNDSARLYYQNSVVIFKRLGREDALVHPLLNIAYLNNLQGDVQNALEYYSESLKYARSTKNYQGMTSSLLNLGVIYKDQNELEKSIEYLEQAIENSLKIGYIEGESSALNNLGGVYQQSKDYVKSLEYYNKALILFEEIQDWHGYASAKVNIGSILIKKGNTQSAFLNFEEGLKLYKKIGFKSGEVKANCLLGDLYLNESNIVKAQEHGEIALSMANELGYPDEIKKASNLLYLVYDRQGDVDNAYAMYKLYVSMKDSIYNKETQSASIKQEAKYQYDKQKFTDDAEHEKQLAIKQKEKEKQQIISYSIGFGLVLVVLFLIFVFNRLSITKKQKFVIEEQKEEVESQRDQIEEQRDDIVASINYAKRIQTALLKSDVLNKGNTLDHFIVFQPKDIVSGDFYWALEKQGHLYIASVDCTGHGVPGAFLTMLGTSFLNEINAGESLLSPSIILNKLRDKIVKELSQGDGESKDGMDISLAKMNLKSYDVEWAGANNPLYILRSETNEIEVIKGDREPIGYTDNPTPFTNHNLKLGKGDILYLFTDGFADQFGGKDDRKMGYKRFRDALVAHGSDSMSIQKSKLQSYLEEWQGEESQLDDICVLGLRV